MGAGATRRDAKEATRLALVRAALELFIAQGFDGPSLDAICAHAGYTRGAFYVHFKDREQLIAAAMRHALDELLDDVIVDDDAGGQSAPGRASEGGGTDEAGDDIERTIMRFVDLGLRPLPADGEPEGPFLHQTLEACRRSEEVRRMFVGVLADAIRRVGAAAAKGQRSGRVRDDIGADELARVLVVLALGARVAVEVELPIDVAGTRDAALRLFVDPSGPAGSGTAKG